MKVIITGSGVSGLVAAHALLKAGIDDFVLLERRSDPVEKSGSVIGLYPQTLRIFDQLGLLEDILKLCPHPLKRWIHLDPRGKTIYDGGFFEHLHENHGHPCILLQRAELMEVLYSRLPQSVREKAILPNKKVVSLTQDKFCVGATCSDGSVYKADILIGCDGVHSAARQFITSPSPSVTSPAAVDAATPLGVKFTITPIRIPYQKEAGYIDLSNQDYYPYNPGTRGYVSVS